MKKLPYFLSDSEIAILVCGLDLIKITGCEPWLEEKINNLSMYLEMKEFYNDDEAIQETYCQDSPLCSEA